MRFSLARYVFIQLNDCHYYVKYGFRKQTNHFESFFQFETLYVEFKIQSVFVHWKCMLFTELVASSFSFGTRLERACVCVGVCVIKIYNDMQVRMVVLIDTRRRSMQVVVIRKPIKIESCTHNINNCGVYVSIERVSNAVVLCFALFLYFFFEYCFATRDVRVRISETNLTVLLCPDDIIIYIIIIDIYKQTTYSS